MCYRQPFAGKAYHFIGWQEGKSDEKESVCKAFEFALDHVGADINSTQIWRDYILFLKAAKASSTAISFSLSHGKEILSLFTFYMNDFVFLFHM